ncbi:uncharacterized protein LOC129010696 [Pongo pygmaeus]|uniref:uncharacterized protein LOC129010696 n=1 Tax=Pongo pygmaeus TaxID=9600 RepID=UPI00300CF091
MWPELKKPQAQLQACSQQGRGAPHLPDGGQPGRGTPHFPDGVDGQRRSSLPRQLGGWAEALLTSQTTGWPGRGAPHFPDSWQPGKGAPHFPDGAAAGQRHSSLPRRLEAGQRRSSLPSQLGSRAEALLTCQRVGSPAKALLTSQTGRPGRGAPHLPVSWAAGQRSSLLPSQLGGRREALLTSQTGRRPGRGAPHFHLPNALIPDILVQFLEKNKFPVTYQGTEEVADQLNQTCFLPIEPQKLIPKPPLAEWDTSLKAGKINQDLPAVFCVIVSRPFNILITVPGQLHFVNAPVKMWHPYLVTIIQILKVTPYLIKVFLYIANYNKWRYNQTIAYICANHRVLADQM